MEPDFINNIKLFDNPENLQKLLKELSDLIKTKSKNQVIRSLAAIQLKNTVNSKEELTDTHTQNRWFIFTEDTRSYIKENSLIALGVDKKRPSLVAGFVSYIACVELPRGLWPTCIEKLIFFITDSASSETIRETSLETIAFICQEIANIKFLEQYTDELLEMIKVILENDSNADFIKLLALNILSNSDNFTNYFFTAKKVNFEYIVSISLNEKQSDQIRLIGLKFLEKLITFFISDQKISEELFNATLGLANSEKEDLGIQSTHIWILIMKILIKANNEEHASLISYFPSNLEFLLKNKLVPVLLKNLCEQQDAENDDELSLFKSASICLFLIVAYLQDDLVDQLTEFLNENLDLNKSWKCIDAGLIVLGSLFKLKNLISIKEGLEEKLDILNNLLASSEIDNNIFINNESIRDTCECFIYYICKILPEYCDKFENLSEVRMQSFKFFLFNKNLRHDWSDSFTINFNRDKKYKIDLKTLAAKDSNSNVVSISSSIYSDQASSKPPPMLSMPPKQPIINLDELNRALRNLKKIGSKKSNENDSVNSSRNSEEKVFNTNFDINENSGIEENKEENIVDIKEKIESATKETESELASINKKDTQNNFQSNSDENRKIEQEVIKLTESVGAVSVSTAIGTASINHAKEDEIEKKAMMYKQLNQVDKEVPPFLLVKLKHVKVPADFYKE